MERFYFQYQTEAMPKGISVEQFCSRNKVPYNIFYKWYKDTRKKIVEVKMNAYVFIGDGLKSVKESPNLQKTIHQVCLAHLKAKFDKASGQAGDRSADIFLQLIAFFYRRKRQYDDEELIPEERGNPAGTLRQRKC